MRCQVLRLVHNDELIRNAAAADVGQRLQHEFSRMDHVLGSLFVRFAFGVLRSDTPRGEKVGQIVEYRLHPGGKGEKRFAGACCAQQ